jgi:hypothetical protein
LPIVRGRKSVSLRHSGRKFRVAHLYRDKRSCEPR